MVLVVLMLVCLALGLAVVLAVAVPARREGRDVLTPHGEEVVARVRGRAESMTAATKDRTGEMLTSVKDKVVKDSDKDKLNRPANSS